jgi:hypothetical protein
LRKLGFAGLSAVWAHKVFSPVITHRRTMRPESGIFQPETGTHNKIDPRTDPGSVTRLEADLELDVQFGQGLPRCECIGEESDEFGMTTTCRQFGN